MCTCLRLHCTSLCWWMFLKLIELGYHVKIAINYCYCYYHPHVWCFSVITEALWREWAATRNRMWSQRRRGKSGPLWMQTWATCRPQKMRRTRRLSPLHPHRMQRQVRGSWDIKNKFINCHWQSLDRILIQNNLQWGFFFKSCASFLSLLGGFAGSFDI